MFLEKTTLITKALNTFALLFFAMLESCNHKNEEYSYYENGCLKSKTIFKTDNWPTQKTVYRKDGTDSLLVTYYYGDSSFAQIMEFSRSGLLRRVYNILEDKRVGNTVVINERGFVNEIIQFCFTANSVVENQSWIYDSLGYLIGGYHYNLVDFSNDTLSQNEDYRFKIFPSNRNSNDKFVLESRKDIWTHNNNSEMIRLDLHPSENSFSYSMKDTGVLNLDMVIIQNKILNSKNSTASERRTLLKKHVYVLPK